MTEPVGITGAAIRQMFKGYLKAALLGIGAIFVARLIALRLIEPGAIIIPVTAVSAIQDMVTYVFIMTFFPMLYTIGLLATRRTIARLGKFVIVTLGFGAIFHFECSLVIALRPEGNRIRLYFPFPGSSKLLLADEVAETSLIRESRASFVQFMPERAWTVSVSAFDADGQRALEQMAAAAKASTSGN
jgi:hypothetical protein